MGLFEALRVKVVVKGMKFYIPAVRTRGMTRHLHCIFRRAAAAQEYAERFISEWDRLHK